MPICECAATRRGKRNQRPQSSVGEGKPDRTARPTPGQRLSKTTRQPALPRRAQCRTNRQLLATAFHAHSTNATWRTPPAAPCRRAISTQKPCQCRPPRPASAAEDGLEMGLLKKCRTEPIRARENYAWRLATSAPCRAWPVPSSRLAQARPAPLAELPSFTLLRSH